MLLGEFVVSKHTPLQPECCSYNLRQGDDSCWPSPTLKF